MCPDSRQSTSPLGVGVPKSPGQDEDLLFVDEEDPQQPPPAPSPKPAPPAATRPNYALTVLAPNRAPRGFVFVPVFDAFHKVLSTYTCTPVAALGPRQAVFGHQILAKGASDLERAEFDKRAFDQVVETTSQLQREKTAALVGLNLDYASLAVGKARDLLVAAFRTLPKSLSQLITVQIVNMPDHIPTTTLGERIAIVRPYFRAVGLQLSVKSANISKFSYMGLHALLFHLGDWVHDERALDLAEMAAAIKQAKSEHLQFGFWGVPDIAMAQKLNQAGVTYLSGPFLGAALDKPAGMRRCTLDEIAAQRR